ncbi:MAG: DNA polymerase III subunit delta [Paludibacteraceae bacterium]|nr:DNA polymerase III subunit delta [Paludibacteraceae bacterium]
MQKADEIIRNLERKQYAPVYMLCGEESYYIDMVSAYMEEHILDEASKAFDQMVLYGKDLPGADIAPAIANARGFAMMGGMKLIIVREAQTVKKWDALALYLDNPQPTTILVICYKYGNPDKRLSVFKNIEKKGGVWMQSDRLRDYQMPAWIRDYMQQRLSALSRKVDMDPKVPQMLADYLGADMSAVVGAVDKLIVGMPDGCTKIDMALVERNVGISKDYNVFELQDALIKSDVLRAHRITQYFASSKDHPMVKELGILYNFFANLMLYHYLPDKSERAVAPVLGISPFFVKDYAAAARRFSAGKTFHIIGYFREIDARSKGVNNPSAKDADLWKELIYKILH